VNRIVRFARLSEDLKRGGNETRLGFFAGLEAFHENIGDTHETSEEPLCYGMI
jgi:hypothetical protein